MPYTYSTFWMRIVASFNRIRANCTMRIEGIIHRLTDGELWKVYGRNLTKKGCRILYARTQVGKYVPKYNNGFSKIRHRHQRLPLRRKKARLPHESIFLYLRIWCILHVYLVSAWCKNDYSNSLPEFGYCKLYNVHFVFVLFFFSLANIVLHEQQQLE